MGKCEIPLLAIDGGGTKCLVVSWMRWAICWGKEKPVLVIIKGLAGT